jgi:hypothetical protein
MPNGGEDQIGLFRRLAQGLYKPENVDPDLSGFAEMIQGGLSRDSGPVERPFIGGTTLRQPIDRSMTGAGAYDAEKLLGSDTILAGPQVNPSILTHELGHVEQQREGTGLGDILSSHLAALLRGKSIHDPKGGSEVEVEAPDRGIEFVARAADEGDPEAIELLQKITPMIESREKLRDPQAELAEMLRRGR